MSVLNFMAISIETFHSQIKMSVALEEINETTKVIKSLGSIL